jgi:hypothetical protein
MKAAPFLHARGNGRVALQALCIAQLLAEFMAAQTSGEAFELPVRLRERTGGNLRKGNVAHACAQTKEQREAGMAISSHELQSVSSQAHSANQFLSGKSGAKG